VRIQKAATRYELAPCFLDMIDELSFSLYMLFFVTPLFGQSERTRNISNFVATTMHSWQNIFILLENTYHFMYSGMCTQPSTRSIFPQKHPFSIVSWQRTVTLRVANMQCAHKLVIIQFRNYLLQLHWKATWVVTKIPSHEDYQPILRSKLQGICLMNSVQWHPHTPYSYATIIRHVW